VRETGSVLGAMIRTTLRYDIDDADFRLPIPDAWIVKVGDLTADYVRPSAANKPVMVLRPLVERTEWRGCASRNPDPVAYAELYNRIRDSFFVVSLADLVHVGKSLRSMSEDSLAVGHRGNRRLILARRRRSVRRIRVAVAAGGTLVIAVFGTEIRDRLLGLGSRHAWHRSDQLACCSHTHGQPAHQLEDRTQHQGVH
jgi:hypothetical protein